ncbi:hypothetical protein OGAPHI_003242 [Ogataea philodendri]|uniref:Uncharacterized protein n=1 Tax=Ogataea philodendri TaxID=1378263 RepID=A0A9P8P745_9ASCO|nr:uncharacterized protein OGAPHI_003242 [Ogataea philodendri]KAH3666793.1 hypothetical protein OGAPHI_003242 [Ogataea philodendri]
MTVRPRGLRFYSLNYPPSYFKNPSAPPKTLDQLRQAQGSGFPGSSDVEAVVSSAGKYRQLGIGLGIGLSSFAISVTLGWLLSDMSEKVQEGERQMKLLRKNQKEMLIQMQNYKKKITLASVENSKKHLMIQGKMQMHVALLREQLIDQGIDPVSIDEAIDKFEENVKMETTPTTINLWVPGESRLKSLIPDAHEYTRNK